MSDGENIPPPLNFRCPCLNAESEVGRLVGKLWSDVLFKPYNQPTLRWSLDHNLPASESQLLLQQLRARIKDTTSQQHPPPPDGGTGGHQGRQKKNQTLTYVSKFLHAVLHGSGKSLLLVLLVICF